MSTSSLRELETRLTVPPRPGQFSQSDVADLPASARSMLTAAIAPGTPRAAAVRLRIRGAIKLNRWLPFRSTEIIAPGAGFVWRARVAGVINGYDRFVDGQGEMRWKLLGLLTVASGSGPDVSRSAAGREAGEAMWVPTALLPGSGVEWLPGADRLAIARIPSATGPVDVEYGLDENGLVESVVLDRWGDPENTGSFGLHRFGGTMSEHRTFGGITIPTMGSVGWHFGEESSADGEFFRFRITSAHLVL